MIDKNKISRTKDQHITPYGGFRITLDVNKLSNNYKIKPYDFQGGIYYNAEELIYAKEVKNIHNYILSIDITERTYNRIVKSERKSILLKELKEKYPKYGFNVIKKFK